MSVNQNRRWDGRFNVAACACMLGLLTCGCGRQPAREEARNDIRGEPIGRLTNSAPAPAAATPPAEPESGVSNSLVAVTAAAPAALDPQRDAYPLVGFDTLSKFSFEISDEILGPVTNDLAAITAKTEAFIPADVKAFNKKRVQVKGFMLPLKVEGGLVTEMLIMKDQSMCCYGVVPKINEWLSVKMVSKGVRPVMDEAVSLFGTLHVGEMRENGYLVGIYRMDGERMASAVD